MICLALPFAGGAMAQELFTRPGLSCDPAELGQVGGPIKLTDDSLEMPGLSCRLSGRTRINRMNADFFDAACPAGGRTHQSRLFINRSDEGIAIVSREFGVFIFDRCK
jgi:hypothetical protein